MSKILGKIFKKTYLTHDGIVCVEGERKCTFNTITVTRMERVTRIIVNRRYLPIRGTTSDVGGISSANSKKNTVNESKILTQRAIFSPLSDGR